MGRRTRGSRDYPQTVLPPLSEPGTCRIAMDLADGRLKVSENGGPYVPFIVADIDTNDYPLTWGGDMNTLGNFANANGGSFLADSPVLNQNTEIMVPIAGDLAVFAWNSLSGAATSVMNVLVNGLVAETITLTGLSGVDASLTTPVAAGDMLAVEYDAGPAPQDSIFIVMVDAS